MRVMKTRTVTVSLSELIDYDFEGCMDFFEELFFAEDDEEHRGILSDISYEVVGITDDNRILIDVTGEPENIECDNPDCEWCCDLYEEDDDEEEDD